MNSHNVRNDRQKDNSLKGKAIRSAAWNYAGSFARALSQFAIGVLLARLLSPHDFGTVAIAWIFIGLGNLFSDFGLTAALVQRDRIDDKDIAYCFWIQLSIGVGLAILLAVFAPQVASLYSTPDAAPVIAVLASNFVFKAMGQTSLALLQRGLRFQAIQTINIASYLLTYGVMATTLALLNYGAWSIAIAQTAQTLMCSVAYWLMARHALAFRGRSNLVGRFGLKVVVANVLSWTIGGLDGIFIGQVFGTTALGLYSRAFTLLSTPMNAATTSLQSVLFVTVSRTPSDSTVATRGYLTASFFLALICFPTFLTIAVIPNVFILGLLGEKWHEAAAVVTPLAFAMPVHAMLALIGPTLMARDKVSLEIAAQAVAAVWLFLGLFLFARSLEITAWIVLSSYVFRLIALTVVLNSELGTYLNEWFVGLGRITAGSAIVGLVGYLAASISASPELTLLYSILASGLAMALVFGAAGRIFLPGRLREVIVTISALPIWLRRFLSVS